MGDKNRIALQIRAVLVPLRIEERRRDSDTMRAFRERALSLLSALESEVRDDDAESRTALSEARREVLRTDRPGLPESATASQPHNRDLRYTEGSS